MPFAADADPLAVVDPARDVDLERAPGDERGPRPGTPCTAARAPRRRPQQSGQVRCWTNWPKMLLRDGTDDPAPAHVRQRCARRPGLGARRVAPLARQRDLEWHGHGDAGECLREVDLRDDLNVAPARARCRAAPTPPKRSSPKNAAKTSERLPKSNTRLEPAAAETGLAVAVVRRAALRVGEHLVRLGDLRKRSSASGASDTSGWSSRASVRNARLISASLAVARHPEQLVVVALRRRHGRARRPRRRPRRSARARTRPRARCGSPSRSPCAAGRGGRRPRAASSGSRTSAPTSETSCSPAPSSSGPTRTTGALRLERVGHEREHGGAPLEQLEQALVASSSSPRASSSSPAAPPTKSSGPASVRTSSERLPDGAEKCALARRELRFLEAAADRARAEPLADELSRPGTPPPTSTRPGSTGSSSWKTRFVTPPVEVITTTITHAGWSSEHLDVADRRRLERRRRHEREQLRRLGERLGGAPQRLLDLVAHRAQIDAEARGTPFERSTSSSA